MVNKERVGERERERDLMVRWERKIKVHHFCGFNGNYYNGCG